MLIFNVIITSTIAMIFAATGYFLYGITGMLVGWVLSSVMSLITIALFNNTKVVK